MAGVINIRSFAVVLAILLTLAPAFILHAQEAGVFRESDIRERVFEDENSTGLPEGSHIKDYPIWGPEPEESPSRIVQAFPQDGAIFCEGSVITLGWRGISPDFFSIERYEMLVVSNSGFEKRMNLGSFSEGKPTYILFSPPGPGRYFWQVWAYMTDGSATGSIGRYFTVESEVTN